MILPLRGADVCGHINQGRCHLAFLCCPSGAFIAPRQQPTLPKTRTTRLTTMILPLRGAAVCGACPPKALPFGFFMLPLRGVRRTTTTNTTENNHAIFSRPERAKSHSLGQHPKHIHTSTRPEGAKSHENK